jgi:Lysylphosphatidylglycerol synthase TM region
MWARIAAGVIVSALTAALLLAYGDYRAYAAFLAKAQYWKLWPLLFVAPATQAVRAYRLAVLLGPAPLAFDPRLFHLSSMHMLFSSVLPLRAGELALPLLLKLQRNVPFSTGVGYVLVIRVFDLLVALTFCGGVGAFVLPHGLWKVGLAGAGIASTAALLLLPAIAWWVKRTVAPSLSQVGKWRTVVDGLAEGAAALRSRNRWMHVWLASMLVWAMIFLSFYISSAAVVPIPATVVVLSGSAASFAVAQPVNGIAGLGVVQAAWAWTANQFGVEWNAAVASGVVIHLGQIAGVVFTAAIAQVTMWSARGSLDTVHR